MKGCAIPKYWIRERWSTDINDWIYKAYPTTPEENQGLGKNWRTQTKHIAIELPKSTQRYAKIARLALFI